MKKRMTRRDVTRALGAASGGLLLTPAIVQAGTVQPGTVQTGTGTPSQMEGPFYPVDAQDDKDTDLSQIAGHDEAALGKPILVRGRVLDTEGSTLDGATVDVWQANHHGRYSHPQDPNPNPLDPNFQGWGIMQTDAAGAYGFKSILPGAYAISETSTRCRHIHFKVSHPQHDTLTTQMYFEGDPLIRNDVVMNATPEELRSLLIAGETEDEATGLPVYHFDVLLG